MNETSKQGCFLLSILCGFSTVLALSNCCISHLSNRKKISPKPRTSLLKPAAQPLLPVKHSCISQIDYNQIYTRALFHTVSNRIWIRQDTTNQAFSQETGHGKPSRAACLPQPGSSPPDSIYYNTEERNTLKPHKMCCGARGRAASGSVLSVEIPFKLFAQLETMR